ncbi:MAG: NAD+ synthase [Spirochaetaceae bacterium]|nr:NAD+ synthase [Spirochaetaceae bacterium]
MKIAAGQINSIIADFKGNREKILKITEKGKSENSDLIVFPELAVCGYPPMDLLDYNSFVEENSLSLRWLQRHLPENIAVALGHVTINVKGTGKKLYNSVSVLLNGEIIFTQHKTLLPTYDVFDESRYFESSSSRGVFELKGETIGIAICEDLWWEAARETVSTYTVDPVKDLLDLGADIIIVPSASPYHKNKIEKRLFLCRKTIRKGASFVLYLNSIGANDSLIFDGNSIAVNEKGELIHKSPAFEEDFFVIDTKAENLPVSYTIDNYEEIEKALVLGLRDYVHKCGFKKVHLGSSGGVDSALVTVLAVKALGAENVKTFAMPSRYSSDGSLTDSQKLAENLGVEYEVIAIEDMFSSFLGALKPFFGGREMDVAEENIQARIRGTLMMAYSNKWGSLVLTTGNKSELATGYCTLYGDMAGGLAVIGDLLKTEVFELCRYINRDKETIPWDIITKPPSAELRPDQKDEDSLPPYDILDGILVEYLMNHRTADEIEALGYEPETVERIVGLVGRVEYKRGQAPPVLRISEKAFGSGRRMPVARKMYEV